MGDDGYVAFSQTIAKKFLQSFVKAAPAFCAMAICANFANKRAGDWLWRGAVGRGLWTPRTDARRSAVALIVAALFRDRRARVFGARCSASLP
ncbi:hypothetical protein SPHINGO8AM_110050 [Sphingomonas sp. 8AM]|nr:hypothetical protein SPHINGO8AM_110050 [Sphingomonas sp. 8AM]